MSPEREMLGALKVLGAVTLLGAALGWVAFRGHVGRARAIEGRVLVVTLAQGIASCAASGGLPPSAGPVPASLGSVSGRRHASAPSDWAAPAFSCAGFAPDTPQLFQVQWERQSQDRGLVSAQADLDGDGKPDATVSQPITCAPACRPGPLSAR